MLITWVPIITRAKNRTGQEEKQVALMETIQREILEERLEQEMSALAKEMYGKTIEETTDKELYYVLLNLTKGMMHATIPTDGKKKVYYISAEFLIGKLLSNNLINLGVYEKVENILKEKGRELSRICLLYTSRCV